MYQKLLREGLKNAWLRDLDHVMAKLFSINWSRVFSIKFKNLNFWSFWPWIGSEPLHHNAQIMTESTVTLNLKRWQSELASFGWPIWIYVMQFHVFFIKLKYLIISLYMSAIFGFDNELAFQWDNPMISRWDDLYMKT